MAARMPSATSAQPGEGRARVGAEGRHGHDAAQRRALARRRRVGEGAGLAGGTAAAAGSSSRLDLDAGTSSAPARPARRAVERRDQLSRSTRVHDVGVARRPSAALLRLQLADEVLSAGRGRRSSAHLGRAPPGRGSPRRRRPRGRRAGDVGGREGLGHRRRGSTLAGVAAGGLGARRARCASRTAPRRSAQLVAPALLEAVTTSPGREHDDAGEPAGARRRGGRSRGRSLSRVQPGPSCDRRRRRRELGDHAGRARRWPGCRSTTRWRSTGCDAAAATSRISAGTS